MNAKFVFLILHYKNADVTIQCIESICNTIHGTKYDVVIVDNASQNGSLEELLEKYKENPNLHFISNKINLGYAKGNNVGFSYAKNELKADYICLVNNDAIFTDPDWIEKAKTLYEKTSYYVLGPDVVTPDGEHQNPFRQTVAGTGKVIKNLVHDIVVYILLKLGIQKKFRNRIHVQNVWEACDWRKSQENFSGVLHGSCMIFSPAFIQEFDGLYNGTFLYVEEDILCYILHKLQCRYIYSNELQIRHCHATSLKRSIQDENKRKLVTVKHRIKSYAKFLRITLSHDGVAKYLKA